MIIINNGWSSLKREREIPEGERGREKEMMKEVGGKELSGDPPLEKKSAAGRHHKLTDSIFSFLLSLFSVSFLRFKDLSSHSYQEQESVCMIRI